MKKLTVEQFNALPKNKKAVLVAKDVIAQIKAQKYIPEAGSYAKIEINSFKKENQINESFNNIECCEVCALGAMLMSCTHLGNKLTFEDIGADLSDEFEENIEVGLSDLENSNVRKLFKSIFTPYQLLMIETAFEGCETFDWLDVDRSTQRDYLEELDNSRATRYGRDVEKKQLTFSDAKKCHKFYLKHEGFNDYRLIAICKNIIKNNGKFKP